MDLLEYQAKELFREVNIPVLPSQQIDNPRKIKQLQIAYPVVLKSQVRSGGRGRVGGVRFVENTIDAIAAARAIFNLSIGGEYPQIVLAEARYDAEREFFLAAIWDYQLQLPVLLGSPQGGIEVEALLKEMQKVVIDDDFSPFYARRLAIAMGIEGNSIESVSQIIEGMYRLLISKDLNAVEINPLGVGVGGEVMALDGKIAVNERAIARHPDLLDLATISAEEGDEEATLVPPPKLNWRNPRGNIGILCNSEGLGMATWDSVCQHKGKPAGCWSIGTGPLGMSLPIEIQVLQLAQALEQLNASSEVAVILINAIGSAEAIATLAEGIVNYYQPQLEAGGPDSEDRVERPTATTSRRQRNRRTAGKQTRPTAKARSQLIVRLVGGDLEPIREQAVALPIYWTESWEAAIPEAIAAAKSSKK